MMLLRCMKIWLHAHHGTSYDKNANMYFLKVIELFLCKL